MNYHDALMYARSMRKNPTEAERILWNAVRGRKVESHKFLRLYIIQHSQVLDIKAYFIVDFYCDAKKIIVELDGEIHNEQIELDQEREAIMNSMGFTVVRFTNNEVTSNLPEVLNELRKRMK